MKQKICLLIALCISACTFAQTGYVWGDKFRFEKTETDPQLVLTDNYNSYLLTYTNVDGILSSHKITIRKFDQKNQLVDTYTQELQNIDAGTLFNFLGSKEISNSQLVVFAEGYTNKAKKKDINKYMFDKTTGKFTVSLVVSYPIESAMRSGTEFVRISENGRYIGLINERFAKKEAVQDNIVMLDGSSLATLWSKDVTIEEKTYERAFTVTNSGKAVILKAAKGWKLSNYLTVVTQDGQEDKQFEDAVMLHDPKAISINKTDYLVDFDYDAKGLRFGDYEKFMFYDLDAGKTIKNNKITPFNSLKDISDIKIRNVVIQNDEIHLFTEAKVKAGVRQSQVNQFSSMTMDEPYYKFGPSNLIIMGFDGVIKEIKPISGDYDALADFYHAFGLQNINGRYFINSANSSGVYEFMPADKPKTYSIAQGMKGDPYGLESPHYVAQIFGYVKDAKRAVLCRMHFDNQMSLVSITGFPEGK